MGSSLHIIESSQEFSEVGVTILILPMRKMKLVEVVWLAQVNLIQESNPWLHIHS